MRVREAKVVIWIAATAILGVLALAAPTASAQHEAITGVGASAVVPVTSHTVYTPNQKEFYLSSDQVGYIRPGLQVKVNSVTIGTDRKPVVDLSITDDLNQPLDRLGQITPGTISISMIAAWWDPVLRQYTAYTTRTQTSPITSVTATQAGTDSGGTFADPEMGHAKYTFKTALPSGFDQTKTHTIGIYATRNTAAIPLLGKNYYSNVEYDFRPDGKAVTDKWFAMADAKSCLNCHDPLSAHGGSRRDVKLCVLCHQPQTTDPDTGNTVDFKVMIHKIHRGENLPSVKAGTPYQIIGFNQTVVDFSTVALPQDIRNCATCHETSAPEAAIWYTRPTRASCGSCHDDVNWETGDHHAAGPQKDDKACANCHVPQGDREWDASIKGAHTVPVKSKQLKGLKATILSVTKTNPGEKPVIVFKLQNGDGSIEDPTKFAGNISFHIGGPTKGANGRSVTDFSAYFDTTAKANAAGAFGGTFDGTNGTFTSTVAIPANAAGTWVATADLRRPVTLDPRPRDTATANDCAPNPIYRFVVSESGPTPRRTVVDLAKCNKCHEKLALHGGQRLIVEECIVCHNPNTSDTTRRPADKGPVESVDFKRLIHRIHTGEELTQEFTVYGFNSSVNNFNEVRFPGDRRDCVACHTSGSYNPPAEPGTLSTPTPRDYYSPMGNTTTACLGCHDNRDAAAHAYINTAPFGEACGTCHGAGSDWAPDKVHAR